MEIYSSGTAGTTAEQFFERLKTAGVTAVVDTRLNRSSQLLGFAKERDLRYFLPRLSQSKYLVEPLLAPAEQDLKAYRSGDISWGEYEDRYLSLIAQRRIQDAIRFEGWGGRPALLCSEHDAEKCHRRLAAQYLEIKLAGEFAVTRVMHL